LRIDAFGRASEREAERRTAIEEKGQVKAAATTLRCYARAYHEKHVEPLRTFRSGQQWINSIEQHVPGALDAGICISSSHREPDRASSPMARNWRMASES
jgi:hypothetical protein